MIAIFKREVKNYLKDLYSGLGLCLLFMEYLMQQVSI